MIFGFGKKKLANEMIGGVDKVKVVLYKIILDMYLDRGEDKDQAGFWLQQQLTKYLIVIMN